MSTETWVTQTGEKILITDMSEEHVRNALCYVVRKLKEAKYKINREKRREAVVIFEMNGDIANQDLDRLYEEELCMMDKWYDCI